MNLSGFVFWICLLSATDPVKEVETLYNQGSYELVIQKSREITTRDTSLDRSNLIELHKLTAFSYVALDNNYEAMKEFKAVLTIDPGLTLDPYLVSPKILDVFDEARKELSREQHMSDTLKTIDTQQLVLPDLKLRTAALSSIAFPGAGQLYSGARTKGWVFVTVEGASLAGLILTQLFTVKAHKEYQNATQPDQIETRYKIYNRWFQSRNIFAGLSVGIWISAPLDILLFPPQWAKGR